MLSQRQAKKCYDREHIPDYVSPTKNILHKRDNDREHFGGCYSRLFEERKDSPTFCNSKLEVPLLSGGCGKLQENIDTDCT